MPSKPPTDADSLASIASDGTNSVSLLPELYRASARTTLDTEGDVGVGEVVAALPVPTGLEDRYPQWHSSYDFESILRAVMLKHVLGLDSVSTLRRRLRSDPYLLGRLGFNSVPNQSTLWRAQNRRFSSELRESLRDASREISDVARTHGLDAPGPVGHDDRDDGDCRDGRLAEQSPVTGEAEKVATEAKRLVYPNLSLDRAPNHCIPESAFWSLQTFCGLRENLHVNEGARAFAVETTRDVTPGGHNHREQLRSFDTERVREMFQSAVAELVAEAKTSRELDRKVSVGIDLTTKAFLGQTDDLEADVFGAKDAEAAYHYATVQVIDGGPPLVLDARPVRKGESRAEIVADLLDNALRHVGIEMVQMDREFDSGGVKTACETRGLTYLNPKRKFASEKATCRRLSRSGKTVHVEEQQTVTGGPSRKKLYVPSRRGGRRDDHDGDVDDDRREYRQQLWDDLADELGLELAEDSEDRMFSGVGSWFSSSPILTSRRSTSSSRRTRVSTARRVEANCSTKSRPSSDSIVTAGRWRTRSNPSSSSRFPRRVGRQRSGSSTSHSPAYSSTCGESWTCSFGRFLASRTGRSCRSLAFSSSCAARAASDSLSFRADRDSRSVAASLFRPRTSNVLAHFWWLFHVRSEI
ncbi:MULTISPECIES: transposase [Halorussus]|uniref:transposase n=1 Tax=Halorussus TaxID=1070314 RepID=UPI0020A20D89|nr:transposase [Halorussus vallis]USZ78275.1 transposase [Halorussus vallis]